MKTRKLVWFCAAAALMILSGCKLFYQNTILGAWKVDTYMHNNVDDTSDFLLLQDDYKITFYKENNDFVEEYNYLKLLHVTNTGVWVIENKTDGKIGEYQLRLTYENEVRIFNIKKISKDTIDISRDLGEGNSEEYLLEPVPQA
jgi:hypothetical protein